MNLKQMAGERAAEFVENEMTIGLGTGSTVFWTIQRLGTMVENGLKIRAVPTSKQTENLCAELKIPLITFDAVQSLDLTIDGADEISPVLDLIKGGGGALTREKLVAVASKRLIIVADESKLVASLGAFLLPVEVVPFGWQTTAKRIENLAAQAVLRSNKNNPFVTDNGNYILDCACGEIKNPAQLHRELKLLNGVVETGLFVGMTHTLISAGTNGVKITESAFTESFSAQKPKNAVH